MTDDEIVSGILGESMGLIVEASAVGSVIGISLVTDEKNELCTRIINELKKTFSVKAGCVCDYCSALSVGCASGKSDKTILVITEEKAGIVGRYIKNLEIAHTGVIKNKDEISVLCDYLSPDQIYCDVEIENTGNIVLLDLKNKKKLAVRGGAFNSREEYALN